VLCEFGFIVVEFALGGVELGFCVGDEFGFGSLAGVGVGEDAVLDKNNT
jgi:hypothetical protein